MRQIPFGSGRDSVVVRKGPDDTTEGLRRGVTVNKGRLCRGVSLGSL